MTNERVYTQDDLLPLSGIQHYAFCERQWGLIHLERQWEENLGTAEGRILHERVHNPDINEFREGVVFARSVHLVSHRLGLWGLADMVEFHPVGSDEGKNGVPLPGRQGLFLPFPVEYKRGKPKKDDRDIVQLCAQALCLEEMLRVIIEKGSLFYGQTQRRKDVVFDQGLRDRVTDLAGKMHDSFTVGETAPARKGVKCDLCSMVDVCLPQITRKVKPVHKYLRDQLRDQ